MFIKSILRSIGITALGYGFDLNCFMAGVKFVDDYDIVEDEPEARAFFIFLGPVYLVFILGEND